MKRRAGARSRVGGDEVGDRAGYIRATARGKGRLTIRTSRKYVCTPVRNIRLPVPSLACLAYPHNKSLSFVASPYKNPSFSFHNVNVNQPTASAARHGHARVCRLRPQSPSHVLYGKPMDQGARRGAMRELVASMAITPTPCPRGSSTAADTTVPAAVLFNMMI